MMEWITIAGIILLGLALIIIEIILVPGTTVVGILGVVAAIVGIWLGYEYFGPLTGSWILFGTAVIFGLSLYFSFRSGAWKRFALKGTIDSRVNEGLTIHLKPGDRGRTLSVLKPIGKAEFEDKEYEVRSFGHYVEADTEVQIEKIDVNTIFVKPIL